MSQRLREPLLALTQGDPAGIGPEITLKAWLQRDASALPPFAVFGDPELYRRTARTLELPVPVVASTLGDAKDQFAIALPVIPTGEPAVCQSGKPDPATARGTIAAIEQAVVAVRKGKAAAVVTNPIAKHVLYAAGFAHPGHTEFLAALAAEPGCTPPLPVMMLWSEGLSVVPVTVHQSLRDAIATLTTELIVATTSIVAHELCTRFGIAAPRLALAGLNPHAGEAGTMGREDEEIVRPAVAHLRAAGIEASGPWPADTMFHARARASYDAAICMYHDQALIPIKTLAFDEAVNVTLGLPFLRTSPDHGTAFDIAGRGIARPDSLIAALRLAGRMAEQQA